jgi:hypothetical protein
MAIKSQYGRYPNNFDLEGFCTSNNLPAKKVVRILTLFVKKPLGQEESRTLVLNAALLKRSVGDIYKSILECLLVNGVIENIAGYEKGVISREYQLADKYFYADGVKNHSIQTSSVNKALEFRNNERKIQRYLEDLKLPKVARTAELPHQIFIQDYASLIKWFLDGKLVIDASKAYKIIDELNIRLTEPSKYLHYLALVDIFKDKDYHLTSDLNHRFYSSFTNLPRFLRGSLRYENEELVGLDVSNTQPLLISIICEHDYLEELYLNRDIDVRPRKLVKFLRYLKTSPEDLIIYKDLVERGKLYESFIDVDPSFDRDIVKDNLVKVINDKGNNRTRARKLIREALKARFPSITMLLEVLKSVDHRHAAWALMTKEAQMFIFHFASTFGNNPEYENIPLFTIHDCFVTTRSNSELLEKVIKQFFQENYKLDIPLKIEDFSFTTS